MRHPRSINAATELPLSPPAKANQGTEPLLPEESMTDDASPMVTAYYEAYLDMRKMLAVLTELRGDDPQDALA